MGTIQSQNFGRVGHVEIVGNNGEKFDFSGLDFKFQIRQSCSYFAIGYVTASVLNINDVDRQKLTMIRDFETNIRRGLSLRVYAGYGTRERDATLIADCDLCSAIPTTTPPDVWMEFKGVYGYLFQTAAISYSTGEKPPTGYSDKGGGKTLKAVCVELVEILNKYDTESRTVLDFMADYDIGKKNVGGHQFQGSLYQIADWITELGDVVAFFDIGDTEDTGSKRHSRRLVVMNRATGDNYGKMPRKYNYVKVVDESNGMIGLPRFTPPTQLRCRTLLDTRLRITDQIDMRSKLIPAINGRYCLKGLSHTGHLRGTEWYSDIDAYDPKWMPPRKN